ncbi:hypothetical protein BY457_11032 [Marinilabilia salmonicolor]|jgi:hypothetical protein|uniref:hypothetical protein n=1 Tax=Marinilabilia salmonicolor TaxID=989 RepID=UPI000D053D4C|nr:hypothetical protein [Marinilabilia salmonicolor]PRY98220.1 hypothetical protein BY457_11032 [Marinilabilia salmonicolor]
MKIFKNRSTHTNFILLIFLVLLSGCALSNITSVSKNKTTKPFSSFFILCVESPDEIKALNKENYENFIANNFNKIDGLNVRSQLEKTISRNLSIGNFPRIVKSLDVFQVDEQYTYEEFMEKIGATGTEAILFVNLRNYWQSKEYVTSYYKRSSVTREELEPNATYYAYLYDLRNIDEYLWLSKVNVYGINAGYDTLNNYFARRISKDLKKNKYSY